MHSSQAAQFRFSIMTLRKMKVLQLISLLLLTQGAGVVFGAKSTDGDSKHDSGIDSGKKNDNSGTLLNVFRGVAAYLCTTARHPSHGDSGNPEYLGLATSKPDAVANQYSSAVKPALPPDAVLTTQEIEAKIQELDTFVQKTCANKQKFNGSASTAAVVVNPLYKARHPSDDDSAGHSSDGDAEQLYYENLPNASKPDAVVTQTSYEVAHSESAATIFNATNPIYETMKAQKSFDVANQVSSAVKPANPIYETMKAQTSFDVANQGSSAVKPVKPIYEPMEGQGSSDDSADDVSDDCDSGHIYIDMRGVNTKTVEGQDSSDVNEEPIYTEIEELDTTSTPDAHAHQGSSAVNPASTPYAHAQLRRKLQKALFILLSGGIAFVITFIIAWRALGHPQTGPAFLDLVNSSAQP